jgi:hypothetical protein
MIPGRAAFVSLMCIALGVALAGCSSATSKQPESVSTPASPSVDVSPKGAAPSVDRPLDAHGVAACDVLTGDQLRSLGLDPATAADESNSNATACSWTSVDESFDAGIALSTARDLELFYEMRQTFQRFEPETIAGYPAVRTSPADGIASCSLLVGNAEDQSFSVNTGGLSGPQRDWCSIANGVASAVLMSLPPRP